jgi:hypothetical protein
VGSSLKAAVLALVLSACGPSSRGVSSRALPPAPMRVVWLNASGLDAGQRATAERRARFALAEEERLHGGALRVDVLELHGWDVASVPGFPGNAGRSWWGGPEGRKIAVVVGADLTCEWTFHEACHLRYLLTDHADPRWATWEVERLAVVRSLP